MAMEREIKLIPERREMTILAAIVIAAALLRFFRLGHQSFWIDEILTAGSYASPPAGISYWRKLLWDVHGPLYSLIMHFWSLAGSSETWLRTPGAMAGTFSVIFFYRWMVRVSNSKTALAGAMMLALSPFHIYYSQEMRFYSLLLMMILLSLIFFDRFIERPTMRRGIILGIVLGLACLSHFMALFLCAGLFVYVVCSGRLKGPHLKYGVIAAVVALVMVAPWIYREIYFLRKIEVTAITNLPDDAKLRGDTTMNMWSYPYALYAFSTGFSYGPDLDYLHRVTSPVSIVREHWWAILSAGAVFGFLSISGIIRSWKENTLGLFLSISLVTTGLVTIAALLNIKVFNARYLFCFFPVYIALLATGLPRAGMWRPIMISATALIMLVSGWNYFMVERYSRDDMKSAAALISSRETDGDLILVPCGASVFDHYYDGTNSVEEYSPAFIGDEETANRLEAQIPAHGRIWYVECRPWEVDPRGVFPDILERNTRKVEVWNYPGISVTESLPEGPKPVKPTE